MIKNNAAWFFKKCQNFLAFDQDQLGVMLVVFPTVTLIFSQIGFLFGIPIGIWQVGIAFIGTIFFGLLGETKNRGVLLLQFISVLVSAFIINLLFFMHADPDVEWYHRAGARFLSAGWNPFFEADPESLSAMQCPSAVSIGRNHMAFLPRGTWIFSACMYKVFGFIEAGDSLTLIYIIAAIRFMRNVAIQVLLPQRWIVNTFAVLTVGSPFVFDNIVGGMNDGMLYINFILCLFACFMLNRYFTKNWLIVLISSSIWLVNLKFSGVILLLVLFSVYTLVICRNKACGIKLKDWIIYVGLILLAVGLTACSPYLSNWVRYGSPFYPEHTFNPYLTVCSVTKDFDILNEHAKQMGYLSRQCYAYISQFMVMHYLSFIHGVQFKPEFTVSADGFGSFFRVCLLASSTLLILNRGKSIFSPILLVILCCVLLQPTKYIGYDRYVAYFLLFPTLILFENAIGLGYINRKWIQATGFLAIMLLYGICYQKHLTGMIGKLYNVSTCVAIVNNIIKNQEGEIVASHYNTFHSVVDLGLPVTCRKEEGKYAEKYKTQNGILYSNVKTIDGYLSFNDDNSERGSFLKFFFFEFAPYAIPKTSWYIKTIFKFRWKQFQNNGMFSKNQRSCPLLNRDLKNVNTQTNTQ